MNHRRSDDQIRRFIELWNAGHRVVDIARELDVAEGTVPNIAWQLRRAGYPLQRRTTRMRRKAAPLRPLLSGSVLCPAVIYDAQNRAVATMDPLTRECRPIAVSA